MMRVTVRVKADTATPAAQRLGVALRPSQMATVAARSGAALVVSHFEQLAAERHRSGVAAVAHNFYAEAARSTLGTQHGGVGFITVFAPVGLRPRVVGGEIRAVNYSYLFIPLSGTPAEGRTAGDFTGQLQVIWNASTKRGVAKQKGKDGQVLFALRESISQAPDDTVLPSTSDLSEAIRTAIARQLQRAWRHKQVPSDEPSP